VRSVKERVAQYLRTWLDLGIKRSCVFQKRKSVREISAHNSACFCNSTVSKQHAIRLRASQATVR